MHAHFRSPRCLQCIIMCKAALPGCLQDKLDDGINAELTSNDEEDEGYNIFDYLNGYLSGMPPVVAAEPMDISGWAAAEGREIGRLLLIPGSPLVRGREPQSTLLGCVLRMYMHALLVACARIRPPGCRLACHVLPLSPPAAALIAVLITVRRLPLLVPPSPFTIAGQQPGLDDQQHHHLNHLHHCTGRIRQGAAAALRQPALSVWMQQAVGLVSRVSQRKGMQ